MNVTVDIHDTSGPMLAEATRIKPIYQTKIYSQQEEGAMKIIDQIILENAGSYER